MSLFDTDVAPAVAEARLLHPSPNGFFTVGRKVGGADGAWKEEHFALSSLDAVSASLRGRDDTYISQASFATKLRRSFNTKSIRCVFVDLDAYDESGPQEIEAQAASVIERARSLGLPKPSYIASSGRGLYAKWMFEAPVNATLLPQWKLLQKKLVSAYLDMGSDTKVVDPARVLRLQETINTKSGRAVSLVDQGQLHSFSDLFRATAELEILKRSKDGSIVRASDSVVRRGVRLRSQDLLTDEALTDLDGLRLFSEQRSPVMMQRMSQQSLAWCRFLDLRDLAIARGGIHKGSRDMMLFWMTNFLAQAGVVTPQNFWAEVKSLLMSFPTGRDFNPLADGSLATLQRRVEAFAKGEKVICDGVAYDAVYTPRNDTLLNLLQISGEEEQGMRTIISSQEKLRRADILVPGRAERRQERQDMRSAAVAMAAQGMTPAAIARELGRDRSTIGRWLTPVQNVGAPYVETRGRRRRPAHGPIRIRLTGRGPVVVGGPPSGVGQKPAAPGQFTPAELASRVKRRQQKPHLAGTSCAWDVERLSSWLQARRARQAQERELEPEDCMKAAANEQVTHAAARLTTQLFARLREASLHTATRISLSDPASLSSNPTTGPPSHS